MRHLLRASAVLICAVLAITAAQAENPAAKSIVKRIDHHYDSLHTLRVHFTQHYDGMGMNRTESGTLLLRKPGRMRWTYSQPAGKLFILDGHNGYFYTPGSSTAQRVPVKKIDDLRSPLRLLLGHTKLEKELQSITVTPNADGTYTVTGAPRGLEQRVSDFRITASAEGSIQKLEIDETDGIHNTFVFTDEQPNVPAPESEFHFVAPAGVTIVDGMPPV